MINIKPWYQSKTIWGSLIAVAAAIASAFGLEIDPESQTVILEAILQAITVSASLFAIFSRLTATSVIK